MSNLILLVSLKIPLSRPNIIVTWPQGDRVGCLQMATAAKLRKCLDPVPGVCTNTLTCSVCLSLFCKLTCGYHLILRFWESLACKKWFCTYQIVIATIDSIRGIILHGQVLWPVLGGGFQLKRVNIIEIKGVIRSEDGKKIGEFDAKKKYEKGLSSQCDMA